MSSFGFTYNTHKATAASAFFLRKSDGEIGKLKLVKLLYFAERAAIEQLLRPIFGGSYASLEHGPVPSSLFDEVKGESSGEWSGTCEVVGNRTIRLRDSAPDRPSPLSRAEQDILESVWSEFGHLDGWSLRNLSHTRCPEWQDPGTSSKPIPLDKIFDALGMSVVDQEESLRIADLGESFGKIFGPA